VGEGVRVIVDPGVIAGYLQDASLHTGRAEALFRPRCEAEVAAIVARAQREGVPVTVVAAQTSTTASSVPEGGWILSTEKLAGMGAVDSAARRALCEPGLNLEAFQAAVEEHGLFYPPDPTSRADCTVGGSVACNASGARSHRFGATRHWVRALRVVLPCGEVVALERGRHRVDHAVGFEVEHGDGCALERGGVQSLPIPGFAFADGVKNATGLFGGAEIDPIDLFIGGEGTLGVVTEVEVDLIPAPGGSLDLFVCVPDEDTGLALVEEARACGRRGEVVRPDSLEWFDRASLALIDEDGAALPVPANAHAAIYIEQLCETAEAARSDELLDAWFALLRRVGGELDDEANVVLATTHAEREVLHRARHAVPVGVNERAARNAMPKLGTDLAVDDAHLRDVMALYRLAREVPLQLLGDGVRSDLVADSVASVTFGHVGDNHLHMNFLPKNASERALAEAVRDELTTRVIAWGGSPSAEHGIGKLKCAALRQRVGEGAYGEMLATRLALDPAQILGRGNLFAFAAGAAPKRD
jgi:D-lactate dehydrogenase (cytochrome)